MVTTELIVLVFLKIIFAIIGAYVVVGVINPLIGRFMNKAVNDEDATNAFIYLLNTFIIVFAAGLIIETLPQLNISLVKYLQTVEKFLEVIKALFDYVAWILLAIIVVFGLKYLKRT